MATTPAQADNNVIDSIKSMAVGWVPPAFDRISDLIYHFAGENSGEKIEGAKVCEELKQVQQNKLQTNLFNPVEKKVEHGVQPTTWEYAPLMSKEQEWMQIIITILQTWSNICLFGGAVRDLICGDTPQDLDFQVFELHVFWDVLEWIQKNWPNVNVNHSAHKNYPWLHARIIMSPIPIDLVFKSTPTLLDMDANGCQLWWPDKSKTMFELTIPSLRGLTHLVPLNSFLSNSLCNSFHNHWPITAQTQCQSKCIPFLQQLQLKKATVLKLDEFVKIRMIRLLQKGWKLEYEQQPIQLNGLCVLCCKQDVMIGFKCFSCFIIKLADL